MFAYQGQWVMGLLSCGTIYGVLHLFYACMCLADFFCLWTPNFEAARTLEQGMDIETYCLEHLGTVCICIMPVLQKTVALCKN